VDTSPSSPEQLMQAYDAAWIEYGHAEQLAREAEARARFYMTEGVDEAQAIKAAGITLADRRAVMAYRRVSELWERIRPLVAVTDGGHL
jgi:hypothetical protein